MTKIQNIKPAEPKLTLAEAKRILAQAVLKLEDHKVNHPEYKESVASIRNVASKFLQKGDAVSRKRKINSSISEEKKNETKKKKEETPAPKEIIVPAQEKPGPCPCINCSKQCHIPGLNISHRCPRCTKSFQKTSHLRSHMLVHTSVREHTCAECAAQFKRHDQLVRHLYTHDPEKAKQRFRCKKCKSTFTRKDNFKIHIKRKKVCRDTIKDGNIDSVLEVLESGKNTVVVKPAKDKNKDRKKSSSPVGTKTENLKLQEKDLNTLQLQGKEAMLVPVTHNSDGTLTITGDAINLPSPEAEKLLAADNTPVTEGLESAHGIKIDNNQYVITCSDDKDLYDEPAKTPTDIVDLDTNMPITDQIAYRSQESEFYQAPTVVIDSGLGYQTEFTNVGVNAVHNDAHFGSVHTELTTSVRNVTPESEPVMNERLEETCEKADDDKVVKTATDHDGKEKEMKGLSPGTRDFPLCAELMRLAEVPQIGVQDQLMGTNPTELAQTELYSVVQTSPSETVYTQQSSENNTMHPSSSYGSSPTAQFSIALSAPCSNSHHGPKIVSNTVDQQVTEEGASNSHLQTIVVGNSNQDNAIQPAQLIVLQQEFAIHDSTQQESSQGTGQISQDKVLDLPPLPVQQEDQSRQTDPPTDILSKVIEDILADTGVEPLDEVDDQIINVMQGGHTITSTPPRTKSAMDLLKAVIFMSSRIPAGSSLPAPAITAGGCEAGGFRLQDHEPGDLPPGAAVGINTDMLETAAPSPKTPDGKTLKLSKTPRKTPRKTPKSRQPKSKNKGSPKNNIDNSHKSGEDSFVKQIFRAKKRLFSEKCDEDENQLSSKIIKLDSGPMILGQDVLEQNDKLRAAALGDVLNTEASCLSKANGDKEGLNISNKQEILPLADIDEERAERDQPSVHSEVNAPLTEVLSPFTEQLIGESLTNRDNILSPISPLQVSSPFTHQESPNFLFFNSPVRSKTPDPQHFTSGRSSPLFLRSQTPDNSFLRSSTPERTILQTPDQSKLGGLSFEQEEQTFEDNFIWRELEHMFKSKRSSPGNPENYWFQP